MTAPPYADTYAAWMPYVTTQEFLQSATGVDVSQLVPGGTTAQNTAALVTILGRASNYADNLCQQVLAATQQTENGQVAADRWGRFILLPKQWPCLQLVSASFQPISGGAASPVTVSTAIIERTRIVIPTTGTLGAYTSVGPLQFGTVAPLVETYGQWTYIAGWPNTPLAANCAQGATNLTVTSALGIYPGSLLTIYDADLTEQVTVAPTYVPGSTTIPLVSGTLFAHTTASGASLSAMPPAIKQAVIALGVALIKTRGAEAFAMSGIMEQAGKKEEATPGGIEEFDLAADLLSPFHAVR